MEELDPSGRVSLVRAGDMLLPAQCLMCGRGGYDVDENFLDIKRDIDDFGSVYFCTECGQEIGYASGCTPSREYEAILLANEQLTAENEKYDGWNELFERLGESVERDILAWLGTRDSDSISSVSTTSGSDNASESESDSDEFLYGIDGTADGSTTESVSSESSESADTTEHATVEGSNGADESASSDSKSGTKPSYSAIEL